MPGDSGGGSQVTNVKLSPQQKWLFQLARPEIKEWARNPPERYHGTGIEGFTNNQKEGQNLAIRAAKNAQADLAKDASKFNQFLMGDIWNPSSNPNLRGAIDAATRPITQNFQEVVMPGITDEFMAAGQNFGGSRRGVAEGIASRGYLDTVSDTASKIVQDQYGNNLDASLKALALTPQTQAAQLVPAQTISGVGDLQQKLRQARLNEDISNWNYKQNAGWLQAQDLISLMTGMPGGRAVSTATPTETPWWQTAIGGASTAAGLAGPLMAFL